MRYVAPPTDDVDAETRPAAVEEEPVVLPVDEPLVLHDFGDEAVFDAGKLIEGERAVQVDLGVSSREGLSLPVVWLGSAIGHRWLLGLIVRGLCPLVW